MAAQTRRIDVPDITDDELQILKELWDRTIRPESKISMRTRLSHEKLAEGLEALESRNFVQRRNEPGETGKWRVTPDGEAFIESYQKPWYEKPYGLVILGLIVAVLGGVISGVIVAMLAG